MNVLVVGCGPLGSELCISLEKEGHDVSVIDPDPLQFDRLPDDFSGYTVTGIPIDQDVLKEAGIEGCDACAAVTSDDNTNLMICQIATELFHVPRVLARIYDPRRGEVFRQFGIHTVCPTNLSTAAILSMLTNRESLGTVYIDCATIHFDEAPAPSSIWGRPLGHLCAQNDEESGLFGLLHADGNLTLAAPSSKVKIQADDRMIYVKVAD